MKISPLNSAWTSFEGLYGKRNTKKKGQFVVETTRNYYPFKNELKQEVADTLELLESQQSEGGKVIKKGLSLRKTLPFTESEYDAYTGKDYAKLPSAKRKNDIRNTLSELTAIEGELKKDIGQI